MMYTKRLPQLSRLRTVSECARFPVTAGELCDVAYNQKAPQSVIDFLVLFSPSDSFHSQQDFLTSCEELELLIREERKMPREAVLAS